MTEDLHRQRVLNFLDVYYSGDIEGALARCTDDVEFVANAPVDLLAPYGSSPRHGRDARDVDAPSTPAIPRCAARCRSWSPRATGWRRTSGCSSASAAIERMVQFDIAAFYTFREGRIAQIREIIDTFDMVEQVLERDVSAVLKGEQV